MRTKKIEIPKRIKLLSKSTLKKDNVFCFNYNNKNYREIKSCSLDSIVGTIALEVLRLRGDITLEGFEIIHYS